MLDQSIPPYSAFQGNCLISSGSLEDVALAAHSDTGARPDASILIFENASGKQVDLDLHGTAQDVRQRHNGAGTEPPRRNPGRPKLGVVAREVTLLPRHWEWLGQQPGGASVALRKLVENARRDDDGTAQARRARDAAAGFMQTMAGNLPRFEDALRSLYRQDEAQLLALIEAWPADIRTHVAALAKGSFPHTPEKAPAQ
ncbi:MAG: DUF2239 family protein [Alphaproteobacteria bacterium]|nr:DUF2239 family protein [Alphaproteobacteria bacterium]